MGRKAKYNKKIKLEIVKRYISGESASSLANEYGMKKRGSSLIHKWCSQYNIIGESAFNESTKNKSYTKEFKLKVIKAYLNGEGSCIELANKYNISSFSIVNDWVLKYNKGIEIKDYNPQPEVYTMKARKTTIEERIEIVKFILNNNINYKEAANKYSVPYSSVYQWVKKYNEYGTDGLSDHRGRPSNNTDKQELTLEEKQAKEIERLKRELEMQKMVNEVLKKNIEIRESMERDSR